MTASRDELHHLIDELPDHQVVAVAEDLRRRTHVRPPGLPLGSTAASVIALAERLSITEIATLDHRHFRVVRPRHVEPLTLLPEQL